MKVSPDTEEDRRKKINLDDGEIIKIRVTLDKDEEAIQKYPQITQFWKNLMMKTSNLAYYAGIGQMNPKKMKMKKQRIIKKP